MNKLIKILFCSIAVIATALAIDPSNGGGQVTSFAAGSTNITFSPVARVVSVSNQGAYTIYASINSTAAATNAPIPPGGSFTFDMPSYIPINSVSIYSDGVTNTAFVAATL